MTPPRNLLILKGSVPWEETLRLLDQLLKRVVEIKKLKSTPQPWQVFSLICASGDKSRGQKSTDECRQIMNLIQSNSSCLTRVPSSYSAHSGSQSVINALAEHLGEPTRTERRCEIFVWNFHKVNESTNYITSYRYDTTKAEPEDPPVSELFFRALKVQEYPDDAQEIIVHPFYGLITSARTSDEFHNNQICISFRVPARDDRETESEEDALKTMGVAHHYAFIVPTNNFKARSRPKTVNTDHKIMLEAAADKLATWLSEGSEDLDEVKNVAVTDEPEGSHMQQI